MTSPADLLRDIRDDLAAEESALDAVVANLDEPAWHAVTQTGEWMVRDQIGHLAYAEEMATLAITDPDGYFAEIAAAMADPGAYEQRFLDRGRAMDTGDLLTWWRRARADTIEAARHLAPDDRIPWIGPPMKPASFLTARLMETWSHGQDVCDALGATRPPSHRLRHVAYLGVVTRSFSYTNRGLAPPVSDVRVELTMPSGSLFTWGPAGARNRISGDIEDFCLVACKRRHVADTSLSVEGADAEQWMIIAQTFGGPPTDGPPPGAFA